MANNSFKPTSRSHSPAEQMQPITDPSGWNPADLEKSQAHLYHLSAPEIDDLLDAVARLEDQGDEIKNVTAGDVSLPVFGPVLKDFRTEVLDGRGFVMMRGLPMAERTRFQVAALFWVVAAFMGRAVSQNGKGHLLGHVKNLGADINSPTGRGYNSPSELSFHSDSCDIFGLCCLHTGKSGGQHRICSSVTVYNEMLKRRPDLVKELFFRFYRSRRGELPPGETRAWTRQPVFSITGGYFAARGAGSTMKRAQGMEGVPDLTAAQIEAIKTYHDLAAEFAMNVDFEPGDISLVNNYVALHARSRYEDWPEPERRRHLLRLWMSVDGEHPLHADIVRDNQGIIEEGTVLHAPLEAA